MFDRPAENTLSQQIRLGRIVELANANALTPGLSCYVSTYTVRFVNAAFDVESDEPVLTLTDRNVGTTITAIAPSDMDPVANQTVLVAKVGPYWYILQEYCDSVTYFPAQDCNPFNCAANYFPDYEGDCDEVPEFGWGVDFGELAVGCCEGNANGRVCLTNDETGNEWQSATFDCGESETAYWILNIDAGTLKLVTVTGGETLVQYNLIAAAWCCMCANRMRLACPPEDPCATDWPTEICVTPNSEYCVGGEECDRSLYDFTVTASGFGGGCCTEYNATWVMSYQAGPPDIWDSIAPASCDANQRLAAITKVLSNWQLSFQPTSGSDIVTYLAPDLSCTSPTVFTRIGTPGCASSPTTLTVYPSLA